MTTSSAEGKAAQRALKKKIEELSGRSHLPAELNALVSAVAGLQMEAFDEAVTALAACGEPAEGATDGVSAGQHALGKPLLPRCDFWPDMNKTAKLAVAIMRTVPEHAPALALVAGVLEKRFSEDAVFFASVCRELLLETSENNDQTGQAGMFAQWAAEHPEAPDLLRFGIKSALTPFLAASARQTGQRHDNGTVWPHGHCPVCGSLPYMGLLEGSEGARLHACSFCSFEYRVPRIGCPFCLTQAHDGSDYAQSEDEPGYLLDLCKKCKSYIKIADFRQYDRAWFAALDDFASITLDIYARQMGYNRPTPSAWGF